MLEKHKQEYVNKNLQFILLNENGVVIESDNKLFDISAGVSLREVHPFFESIPPVKNLDKELDFFCVNLNIDSLNLIVDIKVFKKKDSIIVSICNFTEQYNAYQLVAQSRNESVIKNELTVIKNQELEERERFKNQFIRNFSHELRNPITSVMAISEILHETELSTEQIKMLEFLKSSANNLRLLLEDTLSIGLIDSGKMEIQSKLFSIKELFDLLIFTYQSKVKKKDLSFDFFWDERIPEYVEGDRIRFYQVLGNLLDNALKYTEKGSIKLEMHLNQKWANNVSIRINVIDTGDGIEQSNLKTIFDSFHRLETNEKIKGTGLGLTIVKRLLNLMGSEIKVDSKSKEGSNFYFDIIFKYPVVESKRGLKEKAIGKIKSQSGDKKRYKLLLVEDDENVQLSLFKMLLNTKQFHVDLAYDGNLVLQEVVNNNYDIILMDVNLPNINGDQITKLIRDFPFKNIKNIPILGITANAFDENIQQYIKAGMNSVLVKPFEKEVFLDTIYKLLK